MKRLVCILLLLLLPAVHAEPVYFDEIVETGDCFLGRQGDQWRLYNADSTLLLEHTWSTADFPYGFYFGYPFNGFGGDGTAVVQFGSMDAPEYGCIDRNGNILIPPKYDSLEPFCCGLALCSLNGKSGYVDQGGVERIPPQYEDACSFCENRAAVKSGGKWGYIDPDGRFAVSAQFDSAGSFCCGSAAVCSGGQYGLIDPSGKSLVPVPLKSVGECFGGLRIAQIGDGAFGILAASGDTALEPVYDSILRTDDGVYIAQRSGEETYYTGENGALVPLPRVNDVLTD